MNRVDLNLLVAFDALMAERSVTRAADRLGIGQSAMSSTLGRLRKLLDDPLLVSEGRGLVATPLAESLESPVRDALARAQAVFSPARAFDPALEKRTFTIAASDYVGVTFLRPLLARLEAESPDIRLHILPVPANLDARLHRDGLDIAIVSRESLTDFHKFRSAVLFREDWVGVADADNHEVEPEIGLRQFSTLPYLATIVGSHPSAAEQQLDLMAIDRRIEVTAVYSVIPELIRGTRRIAILPEKLGRNAARIAGLKLFEPPVQLSPIVQMVIWTAANDADPGHRWLRDQLQALAATST